MRGSSFTTFLVFLPLVAIPVLAVFGIPEFQPVNASSPTEVGTGDIKIRDFTVEPKSANPGQGLAPEKTPRDKIFEQPTDTPTLPLPNDDKSGSPTNPFQIPSPYEKATAGGDRIERLKGWAVDPKRYLETSPKSRMPAPLKRPEPKQLPANDGSKAAPFPGTMLTNKTVPNAKSPERQQPAAVSTPPQTVQEVIDRLNRLGIRQHAIGLGAKRGEYYFRCYAPSKDGQRVLRMLEFEDSSLLRAARKVLAQVESSRVVQ